MIGMAAISFKFIFGLISLLSMIHWSIVELDDDSFKHHMTDESSLPDALTNSRTEGRFIEVYYD